MGDSWLAVGRDWVASFGDIIKFCARVVGDVFSGRVLHFFGEALRQAGILILGSALVNVQAGGIRLVFSGDLGRDDPEPLIPPEDVREADYLLIEATYGDRLHTEQDPRPDERQLPVARRAPARERACRRGRVSWGRFCWPSPSTRNRG